MLLTLSTSMPNPADLGFLLHKHPGRAQSFDLSTGTVHVLWPEVTDEQSTVAVLLEVDPVALVRGRSGRGDSGFSLSQYVNDRPYAASSMLSVALGKVFRTAMTGRCDARPELAGQAVPLKVHVPALPTRGGAELVERLFAPLGWSVTTTAIALDDQVPSWGASPYVDLRLSGVLTVADALTQLYVLMPVLDDTKHYWVSTDEVDKLMRAGGAWLAAHPERELITSRYLGHHRTLVQDAVSRLAEVDDTEVETLADGPAEEVEERPAPLVQLRKAAVIAALRSEGAATVVDLGCGEGALLRELVADPAFTKVIGVDVSHRALEIATRRLHLDRMPDSQRARLELLQSSATYRDDRLAGHDAVVLMEVIEHVDLPRLPALERTVFAHAQPTSVLVTTPNVEHNVRYPSLPGGTMRHRDHRFEWTRQEFQEWAGTTAASYGYAVRFEPVGEDDPEVGPPTQLAVFRKVAG
ncbi:3' terminal RNA ribose 2'-O-methyltransferase Hen1 [uncultured Friedmanniella sp.]|uniref:3' terminal RNA ribose 2'-O-methyltransferase Hen1 n=1 Tax=uncultured Friedmanniella sp. TaxID=335381 RepID=UPI0035CC2325